MNIHDFITLPPGNTFNYYEYLAKHPMKHYNEYTEEEIEDLARECERLAEHNSQLHESNTILHDTNAILVDVNKRLLEALDQTRTAMERLFTDPPHNGATLRKETLETPLDTDLPF